eukprot:CAMPEP_0198340916 /NCGR_PEP_ID=MMETSP1450-20131203/46034_1 /TAXON_ID=753684 ORGANISM="Madagascaria erythrocladiodes, Strain CCMP3234" /NCGR_SAMPLE_ID=MMETSP1450 /ASSEMBLY_ACC=CAM_ASM_001115 /LENGTH=50 /DNA_ID=CAMNT_0044045909 /DNA_START=98 /DNA_END=246 /DNA_ORIENTATION=+
MASDGADNASGGDDAVNYVEQTNAELLRHLDGLPATVAVAPQRRARGGAA